MKKEEKKEGEKEIGLKEVLSWIFKIISAIIILIFSIAGFMVKQPIVGVLFLVVVVFLFIPRRFLRITRTLKVVIVIFCVLAIFFISGAMSPKPQAKQEYYNIGEEIAIISYNTNYSVIVYNLSEKTSVKIGDEQKTTNGKFLLVYGYLINPNQRPVSPISLNPYIIDNQNNSYYFIGETFDKKTAMQPKIKRDFLYIFEVPKEAVGLNLYIKESQYSTKIINLGK